MLKTQYLFFYIVFLFYPKCIHTNEYINLSYLAVKAMPYTHGNCETVSSNIRTGERDRCD